MISNFWFFELRPLRLSLQVKKIVIHEKIGNFQLCLHFSVDDTSFWREKLDAQNHNKNCFDYYWLVLDSKNSILDFLFYA